jgi:hypothetical protein
MRQFEVFRGGVHLGRVTLDKRELGGLWEPTPAYKSVRALFERDAEVTDLLEKANTPQESHECFCQLESLEAEIMKPGIAFYTSDGAKAFDLLSLSIYGDRACWH